MKGLMIKDKRKVWENGIFAFLMALAAGFLFWKCRYGITSVDEGLYLTIPYRLIRGDGLFVHEWHLSQMSGVLTVPVVWAYVKATGGTEGLVLFMRYFTTLIQCLIAVIMFLRLRRYHYLGAVASSLCFALYIPFGIMQLSYNSMGYMAMVLCGILLLPGKKERRSFYVLAGLSLAAAVLCCPYLLAVYVIYLLSVGALTWYRRGKERGTALTPWSIRGAVLITIGAAAAAAVFAIFVLWRGSLGQIVEAFRYIMDDPEHPPIGFIDRMISYVRGILFATSYTKWLYPALAALFVVCLTDRKRKERRGVYFATACVVTAALMLTLFYHSPRINHVMWAVNMLAPFMLPLSDKDTLRRLFTLLWVPGMLYSVCIHFSSNQIFITAASASAVATVGTVMMLCIFLSELCEQHPKGKLRMLSVGAVAMVLLIQLGTLGYMRYQSVFWEPSGMSALKNEITDGIQSGLVVSDERYRYYQSSQKILDYVYLQKPERVLYLSYSTWYYLEGDYEMAAYSAWLSDSGEHTLNRLKAYYELNPEKLPDLIFIDNEFIDAGLGMISTYGYEQTEIPSIWVLKK